MKIIFETAPCLQLSYTTELGSYLKQSKSIEKMNKTIGLRGGVRELEGTITPIAALPIFGICQDDQPHLQANGKEMMLPQCPTLRPPLWGGSLPKNSAARPQNESTL